MEKFVKILEGRDEVTFKQYEKSYKNTAANTYQYTGLYITISKGASYLIGARSGWTSCKPTGLAISTSRSSITNNIFAKNEATDYAFLSTVAMLPINPNTEIAVWDRRDAIPSISNSFYLYILEIKVVHM